MFRKKHDARAVANIFVKKFREDGRKLTVLALIKTVYIAHGYALARMGRPLVKQEVQAWRHGPVIPEVYEAFAHQVRGSNEVVREASKYYPGGVKGDPYAAKLTPEQDQIVSEVYEKYSTFSAFDLLRLTHQKGSPWSAMKDKGRCSTIPNDLIKKHYEELEQR